MADFSNNRAQKFDEQGSCLRKWGSIGSGNGLFYLPVVVATDPDANVFVREAYNHRIQNFDGLGNNLNQVGTCGSGDAQFENPDGVAADLAGDLYVADAGNYRLQELGTNLSFVTSWGSRGELARRVISDLEMPAGPHARH